jgi:hypothetical protein
MPTIDPIKFPNAKAHIEYCMKLKENTVILDSVDQLHIAKLENAILIVWPAWGNFFPCVGAIYHLYEKNYMGKILIIDIDDVPVQFQKETFSKVVLRGDGEIFVVQDGQIIKEFLGERISGDFKNYFV